MIREATLEDVPVLVAMGKRFIEETSYQAIMDHNPVHLGKFLQKLMANPEALVLVSDQDTVTGVIGMIVYAHPLSGGRFASELFWWMNPEARDGRSGLRLLRQAERWVQEQGAQWLHMIAPNERIATLYTRLGFTPLEQTFQKALNV